MNQALSRGTVEQLDSTLLVGLRGAGRAGFLERSTERRALGAVTGSGRNRFPVVLGRGCNSWQGKTPVELKTVPDMSREA